MFDIGWSELVLVGAVALVVIGPKDLPRTLRALGQMTRKLKGMASEFQGQFNEAMREADLDDIRRSVSELGETTRDLSQNFNPIQKIRDEIKGAVEARPVAAARDPLEIGPPVKPPDVPPPATIDLPPVPDVPEAHHGFAAAAQKAMAEADAARAAEVVTEPKPKRTRAKKVANGAANGEGSAVAPEKAATPKKPAAPKKAAARKSPAKVARAEAGGETEAAKPAKPKRVRKPKSAEAAVPTEAAPAAATANDVKASDT